MPYTRSSNITRALVQFMRAQTGLYAALTGGIHKGVAPEKFDYPMGVYRIVASPYEDDFGGDTRMIVAAVDVVFYSRNPVDADDVDQSWAEVLDGAELTVTGQTTLICRRTNDLDLDPELDAEGKKVYPVGGTYEIWTDQSPT